MLEQLNWDVESTGAEMVGGAFSSSLGNLVESFIGKDTLGDLEQFSGGLGAVAVEYFMQPRRGSMLDDALRGAVVVSGANFIGDKFELDFFQGK